MRLTGLDVGHLADRELAALRATRIGFVFQQFFLAEHQTALDNVADGLLYAGVRQPSAEQALEALDLRRPGRASPTPARPSSPAGSANGSPSPGPWSAPAIVLADEPTGNLDSATGQSILALFDELHDAGATIVVITHDQDIADRMPRQIEMLDGRIVADTLRMAARAAPAWPGAPTPVASDRRRHDRNHGQPGRRQELRPVRPGPAGQRRAAHPQAPRRPVRARASPSASPPSWPSSACPSSSAGLLAEIGKLGTNLLTVTNGQSLFGQTANCPSAAPA